MFSSFFRPPTSFHFLVCLACPQCSALTKLRYYHVSGNQLPIPSIKYVNFEVERVISFLFEFLYGFD